MALTGTSCRSLDNVDALRSSKLVGAVIVIIMSLYFHAIVVSHSISPGVYSNNNNNNNY